MDQAVADGLTVSIKYHPRIAKVLLDEKKVRQIEDYYKMHFDYAIEDSPSAFRFFEHLPALKVMVYDRPWNSDCQFPGENYLRCFDWKSIRSDIDFDIYQCYNREDCNKLQDLL